MRDSKVQDLFNLFDKEFGKMAPAAIFITNSVIVNRRWFYQGLSERQNENEDVLRLSVQWQRKTKQFFANRNS